MTERPKRFILQAYHPEYACPAFETMFSYELPLLSDERKKLARFARRIPAT